MYCRLNVFRSASKLLGAPPPPSRWTFCYRLAGLSSPDWYSSYGVILASKRKLDLSCTSIYMYISMNPPIVQADSANLSVFRSAFLSVNQSVNRTDSKDRLAHRTRIACLDCLSAIYTHPLKISSMAGLFTE